MSHTCPSAAHVMILLPPLWGIMRAWNTLLLCPLLKVRRGVPASNTCGSSNDDWKGVGGWKQFAVLRKGHHWTPGKQCAHTMGSTPHKHQMQDLLGLSITATTLASRMATCLFGQLAWNFRSLLTLLHMNWQKRCLPNHLPCTPTSFPVPQHDLHVIAATYEDVSRLCIEGYSVHTTVVTLQSLLQLHALHTCCV
jgi:hypothetical protein